ncbi:MAG: hypothetical protein ACP5SI_09505 [Chloroflexia bacterium]
MKQGIRNLLKRVRQRYGEEVSRPVDSPSVAGAILVVDFGHDVAPFPEGYLRKCGFETRLARGESEALETLAQAEVAAVIVSGRAAVPFFRALRGATSAPILALDSTADERHVLEAYAAGVDQFQAQSISPNEVVARLGALLRRRR